MQENQVPQSWEREHIRTYPIAYFAEQCYFLKHLIESTIAIKLNVHIICIHIEKPKS